MKSNFFISSDETFYETLCKESNQKLMRKFYLLIFSHLRGCLDFKEYWFPFLAKEVETIDREKKQILKKELFKGDKDSTKLIDLCKKESILTLEILKIGFMEIEYLCNLIFALNLKSVKLMINRILKGNLDNTRLSCADFLNNNQLLNWFKKIYTVNLLDEYNLDEEEKEIVSEIYNYEREFVEELFGIIPSYRDFAKNIRNVLSHTHSFLIHEEGLQNSNLLFFIEHGLDAMTFRNTEDIDCFEKIHTGYKFTHKFSWYISGIIRLQEVLLQQIVWFSSHKVKLVSSLISDQGQSKSEKYFAIWKRLGLWGRKIGPNLLTEEEFGLDKTADAHYKIKEQRELYEKIEFLMKKYPLNSSDLM